MKLFKQTQTPLENEMTSIKALHNLINTTTHKYIKKYFKKIKT